MGKKRRGIDYAPTGIAGFDEITGGGLPAGRATLVLGGVGAGKTVFGLQVLASGARVHREPGILVTFEESARQIYEDTASFSFDLDGRPGVQVLDARLPQSVSRGGEFDLLGLLAVLGARAKSSGARRIVLDGIDVLLAGLGDPLAARREVFRLREWLLECGLTAIITAKTPTTDLSRAADYEFMQFMADCVVMLEQRVVGGTELRFLRVTKCRGGPHCANEFPITFGPAGIEVAASATPEMRYPASKVRVATGVERLDAMLAGGYYRGSSTLITGAPGTSKTTLAATFAEAACKRGERTLFVSFDEAPAQIVRNLESVGIRLAPHIASGKLAMRSFRSRADSPEAHAAGIRQMLRTTRARNLVVDPISAISVGEDGGFAQRAATEILDFAKTLGVTAVYTSMLGDRAALSEETPIGISTIADTWMHLTYYVQAGERNRGLTLIKSRGTPHSNQVRELLLTNQGVTLADVYLAGGEVLMGTLRWERESEERRRRIDLMQDSDRRLREAELALAEVRARLQATRSAEAVAQAALVRVRAEREQSAGRTAADELELRRRRGADRVRGPRARGR